MGIDLLTMDLVAIRAGVSYSTVWRYVSSGKLPIAKRGPGKLVWFNPCDVDQWSVWFRQNVEKDRERRRKRLSPLARVNGMKVAGGLPCEEQDESDRNRLFILARGADKKQAMVALKELYLRYNKLRLPLEECRVGIDLGNGGAL